MRCKLPHLVILTTTILLAACAAWSHNGGVALALPTEGIVVDGDFTDWPEAATRYPISLVEFGDRPSGPMDSDASFRVAWDPTLAVLYLAIEASDESLVLSSPDGPLWNTVDGCEVFVASTHAAVAVSQYALRGVDEAAAEIGDVAVGGRARRVGARHQYEWRVQLATGVAAGSVIGLDVAIVDVDEDGSMSWIAWAPGINKFGDTARLGDVLLAPAGPVGTIRGKVTRKHRWEMVEGARPMVQSVDIPGTWLEPGSVTNGEYSVQVPAGSYRVSLGGAEEQIIHLGPGETVQADVFLPPAEPEAHPVSPGQTAPVGGGVRRGGWHQLGGADGLAFGDNRALAQSKDGTIWIATNAGLVQFDGGHLQLLSPPEALSLGAINALVSAADGSLWLGTQSGLCRYVDHELACYTRQDGLVSDEVMSLAEDQQGRLWIGTPSGLSCFEDRHFTNFTAASGALPSNNIISLHAAADGRVWVGTDGGLRLLRDPTSTPEDPHLPVLQVTALASAADGRIWAHSKGGRLWGMVGANWQEVFLRKRRIPIAAMEVDDAGELWAVSMPAGGASIVLRYDGQHATNLAPGSGLGNRLVHDLLQDREGNMWLASSAGLHRYDAGHFSRLGRAQGLASNVVTRLLPNADGGLWIGTQRGLSRLDVAGRTVTYGDADGLSMRPAVALAYGVDGKLWVATPVGLARGDSAGFQPVTLEDGSAVQQIRSLAADSRGGMWMARGESGVLHIDAAGKSSHFTTSNSLANAAAMSVATDGDTVWIGTITGLNRLVDGVMTSYDAEHGVPQVTIHDLLVDSHARLWLATDAGLVMYDRRRFETFTATDGVGSDFITTLMEDRDGVLWIGTRTGLSRFDGAHFQSLLARDGLPDDTIQAVAQDAQGDIWVATPAGAVRYRLRREAPLIHVTNVTTDVDHGTANKIHMPSSQQRVEFKFRASSFKTRPEALLFRYRLRPLEPEWRQTRLRSVSYEGLPRDTYTFEVEVIDRDLTRSQMPAQVTLEVHLPYADIAQWSIFALVALAGILLAGQLWRRSAERKERDRRELVLQKMRETIWTLDSSSQVDDILAALQQVLGDVGVPYMACGVNIIDAGSEPRVVYHNLVEGVWSSAEMQPQSARNVAGFRRRGEVVYRRDLRGEDTYQDTRQNVGEANTRRSVIDLPFSHGTLAFNSDRPNAFDGYQPYLEAIGEVLSEAFHRFDDLQALRDRTQRAEVAQEGMRVAKEEAEQANQSKSTFLANMSHEIRTPMNSILGFSDILAGTIEDGQQREFLNAIQASGKSLLGLINDILDLSKVEAGKLELEPGPCDLAAVCHEMEQVFAQKSAEKGVDLVIDVPSDFPDGVILDELRIRQVLINLLGNAIKFTENGTVRLTATAKVDDDHADLCLAVSDTGVGIPADQIDKVFGAFEQQEGQSAAKFGGTGLGLAISRRLSQMMGGDIVVTSEMGKGSTFSVELTRQPVVTRATLATAVAVETVPDVSFRSSSVLVVDDVASNRLLVKTLLIRRGVEVIEAEDGAEALRLAESMRPGLILMDLRMPVMDGLEATRRLRQDETLKAMPVIALTASAMRTAEGGIREVCDGYLAKPVTEVQLVRALMEFLPYDEADATEADAPVDKPAHEWSLQDMPGAARDALPELVSLLDSEQDAWEELSSTLTINDVETFASRMQEMGHRYGFVPLADWAERLAAQASAFDMAAMPETLREYADISATLRAMTR